jgi:hypothetical protein
MRRPTVSDQLLESIGLERRIWCWADLCEAIQAVADCSASLAACTISRGVRHGILRHTGRVYSATKLGVGPTPRRRHPPFNRLALLELLASRQAWPPRTIERDLCRALPAPPHLIRVSLRYARDYGYLERGTEGWALTGECRRLLGRYGRLEAADGIRFAAFLSHRPARYRTR